MCCYRFQEVLAIVSVCFGVVRFRRVVGNCECRCVVGSECRTIVECLLCCRFQGVGKGECLLCVSQSCRHCECLLVVRLGSGCVGNC